jgi:hypothetical protein
MKQPKISGYARLLIIKKLAKEGKIQIGNVSTGPIPSKRAAKSAPKTGWAKDIPVF